MNTLKVKAEEEVEKIKECYRNHDFYSAEEKAFLVLTNQEERERLNWIIMCQEASSIKHFLAY